MDIVVVTAGAAQKPGETRLDLVRKHTAISKDIIPRIAEQEPGIILVVANPVDILTYVALKVSGYPMNRVIGSGTSLDTAGFCYLLCRHCTVDPRNVHAYILGIMTEENPYGSASMSQLQGPQIGTKTVIFVSVDARFLKVPK